jgi:hypothetical protein
MQFLRLRILCIGSREGRDSILKLLLDQSSYEIKIAHVRKDTLHLAHAETFDSSRLADRLRDLAETVSCGYSIASGTRTHTRFSSALIRTDRLPEALKASANAFLRRQKGLIFLAETVMRALSLAAMRDGQQDC